MGSNPPQRRDVGSLGIHRNHRPVGRAAYASGVSFWKGITVSEKLPSESQDKIIVFGAKQIRRALVDDEWFFSVVDIVGALTDSPNPRNYWNMMKAREKETSEVQLSTICVQLKLTSADGKSYKTDAGNTEGAFRIIQSIPGPKAEPFKR